MKDQKMSKQEEMITEVNPVAVAVAGAVVAGIAVAGIVLSDEKKREKISKVVKSAKDSIDKTTKEVNNVIKSL